MRILVTGSRDWTNETVIYKALRQYAGEEDVFVTLVTGACRTGADPIAELFARDFGWNIERYPANWNLYGRAAGPIRNGQMVGMGADICLAFIINNSRGSTGTIDLCRKQGIPVVVHTMSRDELNTEVVHIHRRTT